MLEIFFASDRLGDQDIFTSTRLSTAQPFGIPVLLQSGSGINTFSSETTPELSRDGLLLLFSSDRQGSGHEVYYTTRASFEAAWAAPQPLSDLSAPGHDTAATLQADGTSLLWCSARRPTEGSADMWRGTLDPIGPTVTALSRVIELASPELDCPGNSTDDMTWLFFESGRAGTVGQHDIWVVQRLGSTYGEPYNVTELNTMAHDADPWISGDLQTIYFASNRTGDYDLYVAL